MNNEIEVLKQFFAAINRNEMQGIPTYFDWVGGRFADGFVFHNGKIAQYLSFGERLDALNWAGIEEQAEI